MKRNLFILLIGLMTAGLAAQTGIFGLYFDAPRDSALAILEGQNFEVTSTEDNILYLSLADAKYVNHIELRFNAGTNTLDEWYVAYKYQAEEDIEDIALDAVKSYNDEPSSYNEADDEYTWDLTETRYIVTGYDPENSLYWVEYRSTDYDEVEGYYSDEDEYWEDW